MSDRGIRLHRFALFLLILSASGLTAQEKALPTGLTANTLLRDALLFSVDVKVSSPDGSRELWNTSIQKITIPGRAVNVSLHGTDSRLKVIFTIYPDEKKRMLLVAQSEIWVGGEYSSTLTSLPVANRDKVYYYPLGRATGGSSDNPVEVRMAINVVPYLETLDADGRAAMLSAFDATSQFNFTGEDP